MSPIDVVLFLLDVAAGLWLAVGAVRAAAVVFILLGPVAAQIQVWQASGRLRDHFRRDRDDLAFKWSVLAVTVCLQHGPALAWLVARWAWGAL